MGRPDPSTPRESQSRRETLSPVYRAFGSAWELPEMVTGHITLGQMSDKGVILILEARDNQPGLSVGQGQIGSASGGATATIGWRDVAGLRAVASLLNKLADLP